MTRHELSMRLRALKRTKLDLSVACGVDHGTARNWGDQWHQIPRHVESLVEAWERIAALEARQEAA